jgi:hypothetical protein
MNGKILERRSDVGNAGTEMKSFVALAFPAALTQF